jgi:hypothetical protein
MEKLPISPAAWLCPGWFEARVEDGQVGRSVKSDASLEICPELVLEWYGVASGPSL